MMMMMMKMIYNSKMKLLRKNKLKINNLIMIKY